MKTFAPQPPLGTKNSALLVMKQFLQKLLIPTWSNFRGLLKYGFAASSAVLCLLKPHAESLGRPWKTQSQFYGLNKVANSRGTPPGIHATVGWQFVAPWSRSTFFWKRITYIYIHHWNRNPSKSEGPTNKVASLRSKSQWLPTSHLSSYQLLQASGGYTKLYHSLSFYTLPISATVPSKFYPLPCWHEADPSGKHSITVRATDSGVFQTTPGTDDKESTLGTAPF